jgi:hypothetical protein
MNCLLCKSPNPAGLKFCKNCGMDLDITLEPSKENKSTDKLLFTFIIIAFFSGVVQVILRRYNSIGLEGNAKYIQAGLWILQNLSFLLIPICIKDKNLKTIGLIAMSIIVMYWVYNNIDFLIRS